MRGKTINSTAQGRHCDMPVTPAQNPTCFAMHAHRTHVNASSYTYATVCFDYQLLIAQITIYEKNQKLVLRERKGERQKERKVGLVRKNLNDKQ